MVFEDNHTPYGVPPSLKLNRRIRLKVKLVSNLLLLPFQNNLKNKTFMTYVLQSPIQILSFGKKDSKSCGMGSFKIKNLN